MADFTDDGQMADKKAHAPNRILLNGSGKTLAPRCGGSASRSRSQPLVHVVVELGYSSGKPGCNTRASSNGVNCARNAGMACSAIASAVQPP